MEFSSFISHCLAHECAVKIIPSKPFKRLLQDEELINSHHNFPRQALICRLMYNSLAVDILTITYLLNGLFMIAIPIILGIFLINKFHLSWRIWWIGAATFVISQIFHIPFNTYILNPLLKNIQDSIQGITGIVIIALLLGLSAGVFEECARYIMYLWPLKNQRTWRVAVLSGAGHGGIEAILLGGLVLLGYFNMMAYRNVDLNSLNLTPDNLATTAQQIQAYWSAPWYASLLGAVERIFTIPFHIAASVIVLQVFTRRPGHQQLGWLGLAIFLHTLLDASAVIIVSQWGGYATEAWLGVLALLDIAIIFILRQPEQEPPETPAPPPSTEPTPVPIAPVEETSDNLENTRYQ
jgi:uncharacterized membrane protein YhfC